LFAVPKKVVLPSPVYFYDEVVEDWDGDMPLIWGNVMLKEIPYNDLPVLDMSQYIETPTAAMK